MGTDVLLPQSRHRGDAPSKLRVRLAALLGFVFGFGMAFVTLLTYSNSVNEVLSERPTTLVASTTGEGSSFPVAERDLFRDVRVVCMVLTYSDNHEKAVVVNETWGARCNRLVFISNEEDLSLGAVNVSVEDNHSNLWAKTRAGFQYVYENLLDDGEWFLKADDDTYVVMENLRYMLSGYDAEIPIFFGHKLVLEDTVYMSGGAGYVLSKSALRRFMEEAYYNETLCLGPEPNSEDLQLATCLKNIGIEPGSSIDLINETPRFFPLRVDNYVQHNAATEIPDWMYNMSVDPIRTGQSCCSPYTITFHYIEANEMLVYDFLLYRMHVHGKRMHDRALPEKASTELG